MEFKDGARIYTYDGKEAGSLRRVVIDPETKEITHIVIEKGLLFKEDKVVPVQQIDSASQEKVSLNCTIDELKEMSPLEIQIDKPLSGPSGQNMIYDPMMGRMYWSERSVITETKRTIPDELIALKEGAKVISKDHEHVGNVERVFTDPDTGKVSYFILSQGLLNKTRKSIPFTWVKLLAEDEVYLTVETQQLEDLTEVEEV